MTYVTVTVLQDLCHHINKIGTSKFMPAPQWLPWQLSCHVLWIEFTYC